MAKAKVRFAAVANGKQAQLISISEGSTGDLAFPHMLNRTLENGTFFNDALAENRATLHRSLLAQTPGRTFTYTTVTERGQSSRAVNFIECPSAFLWPLMSRMYPRLSYDFFRLNSRPKDRVVQVADFDDRAKTLIVHYVAADRGTFTPPVLSPWKWHRVEFAHFDIFAVPFFIDVPSLLQGDLVVPVTSDVSSIGAQDTSKQVKQKTLSFTELETAILDLNDELSARRVERFIPMTLLQNGLPVSRLLEFRAAATRMYPA